MNTCEFHWHADLEAETVKLRAEVATLTQKLETANAEVRDLRRLMGPYSTVEIALKAQKKSLLQVSALREKLREVHNGQGYRDGTGPCDCQWCTEKQKDELGKCPECGEA